MITRDKVLSKESITTMSNAYWSTSKCLRNMGDLSHRTVIDGMDFLRDLYEEMMQSHLLLTKRTLALASDED